MSDFGNCHICGYEAKSKEEVDKWAMYGCCRAIVVQSDNGTRSVELCALNRTEGGFYAPGTNPERIEEDPDALKDGFRKIDEQKAKARERLQEELSKPTKPK